MRRFLARLVVGAMAAALLPVVFTAGGASAVDNGLALTPPMGFNDWNSFGCNVDEQLIEQTADLFVSSGLKDAGYDYINIDDCWMASERVDGHLVADPTKFPDGIKAVADYVHSKGLKLGIYESAGTVTCQRYPGSLGHEYTDARDFADWGVDYLKYDNCGAPSTDDSAADYAARYQVMADAIKATGRDMVYSVCEWGNYEPWNWAGGMSNLWRTTGDISDNYASMLNIVKQNAVLSDHAEPGAWNDPDMLEIGNGGMTDTEYKSHFSLWAEMAAPLLIGTDLRAASDETMAILENEDVIAVDQDSLGKQGKLIGNDGTRYVFAKPLADGSVAVALFNSGDTATTVSTTAKAAGLGGSHGYRLKDLWSKKVTETAGTIGAFVPAHGTTMFRVRPDKRSGRYAPNTVLSVSSADAVLDTGDSTTVTVSLRNDGADPATVTDLGLTVPSGWHATPLGREHPAALHTGQSDTMRYRVTAPGTGPALSTVDLTGTARYTGTGGPERPQSTVEQTLASPVGAPYSTADTTGAGAAFGSSGDTFAIRSAGANVGPASSSPLGSTAAADEYGAIYRPAAAGDGGTVTTTVSALGTSRGEKAGLMVRNDMTGNGSPVGVALYVGGAGFSGTRTVGLTYATDGGTAYTTTVSVSGPTDVPVSLKLVRSGTSYTGYWSADGSTWTTVGTVTVADAAAASTQDAGMFHTAGSTTATEADFDGFTVQ
jgi:alpha-galactosidase